MKGSNVGCKTSIRDFAVVLGASLIFICSAKGQVADVAKVATHCRSDEQVIFSCLVQDAKTISFCASRILSKETGTLQYRFGRIGKTYELSYPRPAAHPNRSFWFDSSHGGQWAEYDLGFSTGQFAYELLVQTNSAMAEDGASLIVFRGHHRVANMECRFDNSINNMWMLEELGVRPHSWEFSAYHRKKV